MKAPHKPVFFLSSSDEMRHPYESALHSAGKRIFWFSDLSSLLAAGPRSSPQVVIVDLDVLKKPVEEQLEQIRASFTECDLIGLSSTDSAQLALLCIRSGFTEYLLKPTSPEELSWSIRKCQQRHELLQKLDEPGTSVIRALTQISSCTTPTLVRLCTLEYAHALLGSTGAAWIRMAQTKTEEINRDDLLCFLPKGLTHTQVLRQIPAQSIWKEGSPPLLSRKKKGSSYRLFIKNRDRNEGILFFGLKEKPKKRAIQSVQTFLEHSELSLLNIQKFEEIKQQTFVDDLTGLYNSRYLKFAIVNAIQRCKKPTDHFSVLFIDVDHFKSINDGNGHVVGSEFLVAIGKTIRHAVRNIDPVFRYGGDEFVVILQDTSTAGAKEIAERIRKHIERRIFVIKGIKLQTTVSIGVACYPEHAKEHESIMKLADQAMYSVKKNTRNAVSLAVGLDKPAPQVRHKKTVNG